MKSLSTNSILLGCDIYKNESSLKRNLIEIRKIFEAVKTSYGPLGLDKMCVSGTGEVLITNDGATILKNMLLNSSTAKLLVNLALEQDKEVGDGTTTVVLLATFLIESGYELIKSGVHPSIVVSGYRLAYNQSVKFIKEKMNFKSDSSEQGVSNKIMESLIRTTISSKIINEESNLFVEIIKKCISATNNNLFTDSVNIIKSIGGSISDTEFYNGFLLNCSLASPLMDQFVCNKEKSILLLDFSLNITKLPLTANISASPEEIELIRKKEIDLTVDRCNKLIETGADLILTTGGIDELFIKKFVEKKIIAVKRVSKLDLQKISKCGDIEILRSFEGVSEKIDKKFNISLKSFPNITCLLININSCTILLKGPNYQVVEESERSLNDAIQIVKRALKNKNVLPGGGAVESTLYIVLENYANRLEAKEHAAIHRYSESLLELVKVLCSNSGLDGGLFVGRLCRAQRRACEQGHDFLGLDVLTETIQPNLEQGIIEPTIYKLKALKAATEAAIAVLRINETIVFKENQ